jgi:hypothetical protein
MSDLLRPRSVLAGGCRRRLFRPSSAAVIGPFAACLHAGQALGYGSLGLVCSPSRGLPFARSHAPPTDWQTPGFYTRGRPWDGRRTLRRQGRPRSSRRFLMGPDRPGQPCQTAGSGSLRGCWATLAGSWRPLPKPAPVALPAPSANRLRGSLRHATWAAEIAPLAITPQVPRGRETICRGS